MDASSYFGHAPCHDGSSVVVVAPADDHSTSYLNADDAVDSDGGCDNGAGIWQ